MGGRGAGRVFAGIGGGGIFLFFGAETGNQRRSLVFLLKGNPCNREEIMYMLRSSTMESAGGSKYKIVVLQVLDAARQYPEKGTPPRNSGLWLVVAAHAPRMQNSFNIVRLNMDISAARGVDFEDVGSLTDESWEHKCNGLWLPISGLICMATSTYFLHGDIHLLDKPRRQARVASLSTSDFQSEVGEVFGEIGGELPAKFGKRFFEVFLLGKSSEAFSTKTPPRISPLNFTARFWVVAGPTS